ncbi:unnamed protein product [Brassica rapa]|uniref:Uncharacterized protein n=2 Tax=Brassica TaxID=3705 RepID=A0A8D9GND4_BRACM|nr:unnamed protein product [Brassica napus]CAG7883828.1 unnamed protein product [Brassica rapa]
MCQILNRKDLMPDRIFRSGVIGAIQISMLSDGDLR